MNALELVRKHGSIRAAARAADIPYATFHGKVTAKRTAGVKLPKPARKPIDVEATIARLARASERHEREHEAVTRRPIHVHDNLPVGILWFGDPHLGTHTDWHRLQRDVALCVSTPGMYGANIGDTTNNWTGRLIRLYAEEDIDRASERALAKWFLADAGVTWLCWLMGNHDEWEHGSEILRLMDIHGKVPMHDWAARFDVRWRNGKSVRIHAAHDFPGHSIWNPTHGPARAPRMLGSDADLFVCGHKHCWGVQQFELTERNRAPVAIRVRGYKRRDPYARRHGYQDERHGCSILTILNPNAGPAGRVMAFADVEAGAKVLAALRGGR